MSEASVKLMLLGIALILFGLAFSATLFPLLRVLIAPFGHMTLLPEAILLALFPVAGLVVAFFGFFTDRRQRA